MASKSRKNSDVSTGDAEPTPLLFFLFVSYFVSPSPSPLPTSHSLSFPHYYFTVHVARVRETRGRRHPPRGVAPPRGRRRCQILWSPSIHLLCLPTATGPLCTVAPDSSSTPRPTHRRPPRRPCALCQTRVQPTDPPPQPSPPQPTQTRPTHATHTDTHRERERERERERDAQWARSPELGAGRRAAHESESPPRRGSA
jgi:hypothetical protein